MTSTMKWTVNTVSRIPSLTDIHNMLAITICFITSKHHKDTEKLYSLFNPVIMGLIHVSSSLLAQGSTHRQATDKYNLVYTGRWSINSIHVKYFEGVTKASYLHWNGFNTDALIACPSRKYSNCFVTLTDPYCFYIYFINSVHSGIRSHINAYVTYLTEKQVHASFPNHHSLKKTGP